VADLDAIVYSRWPQPRTRYSDSVARPANNAASPRTVHWACHSGCAAQPEREELIEMKLSKRMFVF
jgi:hypothetical protein